MQALIRFLCAADRGRGGRPVTILGLTGEGGKQIPSPASWAMGQERCAESCAKVLADRHTPWSCSGRRPILTLSLCCFLI